MEHQAAITILASIIVACGILVSCLIVFLALVPERKRRKYDIIRQKILDLEIKKIDFGGRGDHSEWEILRRVEECRRVFETRTAQLLQAKLTAEVLGRHISLNRVNYGIFVYEVFVLVSTLTYMLLISSRSDLLVNGVIYVLAGLAAFGFILIVPMSYWSTLKDFEI